MRALDLTGITFGDLLVLSKDKERHKADLEKSRLGAVKRVRIHWLCKCTKCGRVVSVRGENLRSGNTKGCGCTANERTGAARLRGEKEFYGDFAPSLCN